MFRKSDDSTDTKPEINVTPLIDVLLVLLIIFMVAVPLRPSTFKTKVPSEPDNQPPTEPHIWTLVVTIEPDHSLKLNSHTGMGTVEDTSKLSTKLAEVFAERIKNRAYKPEMLTRVDLPDDSRVEKTVFIKAPRSMHYLNIVKVIDGLKGAGANPIGLQIDALN